ncbi:MAG: hypothetical protein MI725_00135, partial [Pirellulales bacterium]|nr:hypothetical protein [Pirellulales bacterium]
VWNGVDQSKRRGFTDWSLSKERLNSPSCRRRLTITNRIAGNFGAILCSSCLEYFPTGFALPLLQTVYKPF